VTIDDLIKLLSKYDYNAKVFVRTKSQNFEPSDIIGSGDYVYITVD
jgi:hypothetical protein